jgi:C2 domain
MVRWLRSDTMRLFLQHCPACLLVPFRFLSPTDTINPVWGETFTFTLPDGIGLKNMVLKVKVMDKDPLRDDKLGSAKVKLEKLGLSTTPSPVVAVVDNNIFTKDGKIFLQLSYKN